MFNNIQNKILKDLELSNFTSFKKASAKNINKEFLLECIKKNAKIVLDNFPYNIIDLTQDISEAIIIKNKYLIEDIPREHITYEMAKMVIEEKASLVDLLPTEIIDRDLAFLVVEKDGYFLKFIPEHLKDRELCLKAIENEASSIEFVSRDIRTDDFYIEAMKLNEEVKSYTPKRLKEN